MDSWKPKDTAIMFVFSRSFVKAATIRSLYLWSLLAMAI